MWTPRCTRWILPLLLPAGLLAQDYAFPTQTIERQILPVERYFDGTVEAVHRATVSAQIAGRIEEVLFDVDDFVEAGDVLVRFRSPEQQAAVDSAEAALREAEALAKEASAEYQRIKEVFSRNLVSQSAMDRAEAELQSARARVNAARSALTQAREGLEYTTVRAPYSGIVTERHVEEGETATVGQPLMSGLSLDRLRVTARVPQAYVEAVREAQRARVYLSAEQTPIISETIIVFPYADSDTHTFPVRVELPANSSGLYPGMFLKVGFTLRHEAQLQVPEQAVVSRSELTGVYVVDSNGSVYFRQLRLGDRIDGQVRVLAGLGEGETIALDPVAAGIALKSNRLKER
ncbi:MAG: efflux RND transporter periplasmic adaptor subunit [Thiogranum sp.]|nr:efflux RND transporter periplasmic adaptor subunit [Thiogranum sp.]